MNGMYLIPANSKKSMMLFGMFYPFDLLLFGVGVLITMILLIALPMESLVVSIIAISPGLITGLLVFPIPNYHNTLTVLMDAWKFYTTDSRKYIWKGWCVMDEQSYENEKH